MARKRKKTAGKGAASSRKNGSLLKTTAAVLLLFVFAGLFVYAGHLDTLVRRKFDGTRWTLPAVVYARPLELFVGRRMTPAMLEEELLLAGYRQEDDPQAAGGFHRQGNTVRLVSRAFHFVEGQEKSARLIITFRDNAVAELRDSRTNARLSLARLDPARIGSFHPLEHEDRILLSRQDLPARFVAALVAVEDRNFFSHQGVDPFAILRAIYANLRAGETVQGGSTLTQQLVKNFFLNNERTLWRKFNEAVMALLLEYHYSKDEILTAYANEVFLGQDGSRAVHGFGLASQFYFRRDLADLSDDQIGVLIALVKGPSYYDPRRHPERCRQRRDVVLAVMRDEGLLSGEQFVQARQAPLIGADQILSGFNRFPAFLDLVRRQLGHDYREDDLAGNGLKIFTTLDPQVQMQVEKSLSGTLGELEKRTKRQGLQGAVVVAGREDGEIQAIAGGRVPRDHGFNRALDASRPVGSLIKPVVFLTALMNGYTLATPLEDSRVSLKNSGGGRWSPANYDRREHGTVPLIEALAFSYNLATVRTGMAIGVKKVVETAKKLGAEGDFPAYPSFLLGSGQMTPLAVAQMYQTFAAGGFHVPQRAISAVLSADNKVVQRYGLAVEQRFDPLPVFLVNSGMQRVTSEGTAAGLVRYLPVGTGAAGKTGTSDDLKDSWFAGFTGDRLAVVWVGTDDNRPTGLTGSGGAMVVWGRIMQGLQPQPLDLTPPEGVEWARVGGDAYGPLSQYRDRSDRLPFARGTAPRGILAVASAPAAAGGGEARESSAGVPGVLQRLRKLLPW
ncbi:MAG: penicillin-binding protein 1B [Thermodesulfobacteriota bacterium]